MVNFNIIHRKQTIQLYDLKLYRKITVNKYYRHLKILKRNNQNKHAENISICILELRIQIYILIYNSFLFHFHIRNWLALRNHLTQNIYFHITFLILFLNIKLLFAGSLVPLLILQSHLKILFLHSLFVYFRLLINFVFLKGTRVVCGASQTFKGIVTGRYYDGVFVYNPNYLFLFVLMESSLLMIAQYFCYFLLEIFNFDFQFLFLLGEFIPRLSEAIYHDAACDFQQKLHYLVLGCQLSIPVNKAVEAVYDGCHPLELLLLLLFLCLSFAALQTLTKICFLAGEFVSEFKQKLFQTFFIRDLLEVSLAHPKDVKSNGEILNTIIYLSLFELDLVCPGLPVEEDLELIGQQLFGEELYHQFVSPLQQTHQHLRGLPLRFLLVSSYSILSPYLLLIAFYRFLHRAVL